MMIPMKMMNRIINQKVVIIIIDRIKRIEIKRIKNPTKTKIQKGEKDI